MAVSSRPAAHFASLAHRSRFTRSFQKPRHVTAAAAASAPIKALVFDCDGVILESEDIHREAYNAAFHHFTVSCDGGQSVLQWSKEFYDQLQNQVGGGKPKMRWYFGKHGWPISGGTTSPPESEDAKEGLIDVLQDWKTGKYKEMIGSGEIAPRPGVLRLMEEAKSRGLKVAVCSAATKSSVVFTLKSLLGEDTLSSLDCFLAGDDVKEKKPSPLIYQLAAETLGVEPEDCLVIEDSMIGLEAAVGAGMRCLITPTSSTSGQPFPGAEMVVPSLDGPPKVNIEDFC